VLKKAGRKDDAVDVPADNPDGTMDRFTEGLRRVLAAPKPAATLSRKKSKRRRRRR
jgi:hypothetical protein